MGNKKKEDSLSKLSGREKEGESPVREKWLSILFVLLLSVLTAASLCKPDQELSADENRKLAQRPRLSLASLFSGTYGEDYESYLADQIPFRSLWIQGKTGIERALQKKEVNGVYLAADGYLMEAHTPSSIEESRLEQNLEYLKSFVEDQKSVLGEDHVRVILVPSASAVLTEKLPAFAQEYDQLGFLSQLSEEDPVFLNTGDILTAAKEQQIYYRTDHHWTMEGAFAVYQEWARSIGLKEQDQEVWQTSVLKEDFLGTLYSKVLWASRKDELKAYRRLEDPVYHVTYDRKEISDQLFSEQWLSQKDSYSVYLDGNHALTEIRTDRGNGRRLLIVKDSFAHCFATLAAGDFEETDLVDFRYLNLPLSQYRKEKNFTDVLVLYSMPGFAEDPYAAYFLR